MNKTFKILLKPLTYLCSYFSWRSLTHILLSVQGNSTWICGIDSRHLNSILWIGYDIGNGWIHSAFFSLFNSLEADRRGVAVHLAHHSLGLPPRHSNALTLAQAHWGIWGKTIHFFIFSCKKNQHSKTVRRSMLKRA